ncbi:DUF2158 domain-containing protein [Burkholderia ambifaria]|uniref:YodC family protein n=1 Tax=Burkholderia ambifaria TaxID=152480 RepID=UPI001E3B2BD8|nr:DUF2158 domain-containing protein [Burkholderia ambifaria]UEP49638.1 DUF2158 domain-containing protein [Burkholderia ambifaria]
MKPASESTRAFSCVTFGISCYLHIRLEVNVSALKMGDVVVLKSGGPMMTIGSLNTQYARCQWFDGKELKHGDFGVDSLKYPEKNEGSVASRLA